MDLPKRILAAVDFSDTSERALEYAIAFAKVLGAKITVAHVYELPIYGFPSGAMVATAEVATQIMTGAQTATAEICKAHAKDGVELTPVVRRGITWQEIHRIAEEVSADLIIVGTHGRTGIAHALLGSVAEKIIRTATRPVLTVHGATKS
jgi:nucleotide-binding universal stress UspA family protein